MDPNSKEGGSNVEAKLNCHGSKMLGWRSTRAYNAGGLQLASKFASFIQQQIQYVFQAAVPYLVQELSEQAAVRPRQVSSPTSKEMERNHGGEFQVKESKVAELEKFWERRVTRCTDGLYNCAWCFKVNYEHIVLMMIRLSILFPI